MRRDVITSIKLAPVVARTDQMARVTVEFAPAGEQNQKLAVDAADTIRDALVFVGIGGHWSCRFVGPLPGRRTAQLKVIDDDETPGVVRLAVRPTGVSVAWEWTLRPVGKTSISAEAAAAALRNIPAKTTIPKVVTARAARDMAAQPSAVAANASTPAPPVHTGTSSAKQRHDAELEDRVLELAVELGLSEVPMRVPGCDAYSCASIITPAMVYRWFEVEGRNKVNRKLSPHTVRKYRTDMQLGHWVFVAQQGLMFGLDGAMRDGQHRCVALSQSGVEQLKMTVTLNVSPDEQRGIDQVRPRTITDNAPFWGIDLKGKENVVRQFCGGPSAGRNFTNAQASEMVLRHTEAFYWMAHQFRGAPIRRVTVAPVQAAFGRAYYHCPTASLEAFIDRLYDRGPSWPEGDPAEVLLRFFLTSNKRFSKADQYHYTAWSILRYVNRAPVKNKCIRMTQKDPFLLPDDPEEVLREKHKREGTTPACG